MPELPVVVIGAGPQGLAMAAHLVRRGVETLVLDAGARPAHAVGEWAHVRLFSAWDELIDPASRALLQGTGWVAPQSGYPTGAEWIERYLAPLAAVLGERVRLGSRVTGVSRRGRDRVVDAGRASLPFTVRVSHEDGSDSLLGARAVVDASGTWASPNPAGADGLPALGEEAAASRLAYRIPDAAEADALAGSHVAVVGSGHSATTAVIELARVARGHPGTDISWVLRRGAVGDTFGGGDADELPMRGALGARAREAVENGLVRLVTGFRTERIRMDSHGVVLEADDSRVLGPAQRVYVLTGFRPDLSFLSELRLDLDPVLQAPPKVAIEVDPNVHSCGSVAATGAADLVHPEPGFYIVGSKSYGRAPTFLALTGYEQVRSVAAALAGDHEAARRVELTLPETGVCGGSGSAWDDTADVAATGCCGAGPVRVSLTTAPVR